MNADTIWQKALTEIQKNVTQVGYDVYIKNITPISIENNILNLVVSMSLNKSMIEKRYTKIIEDAATHAAGTTLKIDISVNTNPEALKEALKEEEEPDDDNFKRLNNKYTFDNFVIGTSNELAHATALNVAQNPGKTNTMFLYGNSGLGKTHLMCAVGNYILKENEHSNIIYVSSEKFTNDFIQSLRENKTAEFRKIYRNADVLLIDDIQFLAHKEQTQEEFFHTFEELSSKNKQIVITSDRTPQELVTLELRLRTRFAQGYLVDITTPSYETRIAILQKKALIMGHEIDLEILSFIAERIKSNVRELEGALIRLITHSELKNTPITLEFAKNSLKDIIPDAESIRLTPDKIIEKVCSYFSIKKDVMMADTKKKNIAIPRQIAMYLCKELTTINFVEMTSYFNRDRTTIMHNVDKISSLIETDQKIRSDINYIRQDLNN